MGGPGCWSEYAEPFTEDMPEAPGDSAYRVLEEELLSMSARWPQLSVLILRPSYILGPVPRPSATCMNLSLCLGIYAVLCRELGRPMRFLGPAAAWTALHNLSHSDRVAQLAVNGGAVLPTLALTKCMPLN